MKLRVFAVRAVVAVAVFLAPRVHAALSPLNLKCDGWQNPLGIDESNPRLSWQVAATNASVRGESETAYEIQVATSTNLLASGQPDLWDSGKVVAAQPFYVPYGGGALASVEPVFWQVRVWDVHGEASAWSAPATWTMGMLSPTNWLGGWLVPSAGSAAFSLGSCSWIWYPEGNPASAAPVGTRYFLKSFAVRTNAAVATATLLVTADNAYTAYLNGTPAGSGNDYTSVTPTDVTGQLQPGRLGGHAGGRLRRRHHHEYRNGCHLEVREHSAKRLAIARVQ